MKKSYWYTFPSKTELQIVQRIMTLEIFIYLQMTYKIYTVPDILTEL